MENKHNFMETDSITSLMIKFSLPAIIGMIVNALYNIVDRVYIGNIRGVGHYAIAGVGITFPTVIFSFSFAILIGIGGSSNISLDLGRKKFQEAEKYLGTMVFFGLCIAVINVILYLAFIEEILVKLGASGETLYYAKEYMFTLTFGVPGVIIGFLLNAAVRSDGSPRVSMGTLLIGAISNIILDPIFIFYFGMGVKGAAVATIISQYISMIWTLYYFTLGNSRMKLHLNYIRWNFEKVKQICLLGSSSYAIQLAASVVNIILNRRLVLYGGDIAIAAMAIIQSLINFMTMPIIGINQGIQPILGYNYGANLFHRVKETLFKAIIVATFISTCGFLACTVFGRQVVNIFTKDPNLADLTVYSIKIGVMMFPVLGFQIISSVYFQAVGKPKLSFIISLSRQVLALIPCLYIMSYLFGLEGIWYSVPVADSVATITSFILIRKELKLLNSRIVS